MIIHRPVEVAGADAIFLHLEGPDTPGHTLKVVTLDARRRAAGALTHADLVRLGPSYVGLSPRFTQVAKPVDGRLFWLPDTAFDISAHLDEVTLSGQSLDHLCESLATQHLDRARPLWAATLVHGLPEGRQAIVLRVHHAIMDGLAAVNLLQALTTATQGEVADAVVAAPAEAPVRAPLGTRLMATASAWLESRQLTRSFGPAEDMPSGMSPRSTFNQRSGAQRRCASRTISFADLKAVAARSETTLNGAFHAVLGQALRAEMLARGLEINAPLIATFGVVGDATSKRNHGNDIATARVLMHTQESDPATLAARTAASCAQAVASRRHHGFALHRSSMEITDRVAPLARTWLAGVIPVVPNHITTANVPGPRERRWCGDVEVVGLTSYSLAIAPADVSITAYSYEGRMWLGLITTPESMPDPAGFLDRIETALGDLVAADGRVESAEQVGAGLR